MVGLWMWEDLFASQSFVVSLVSHSQRRLTSIIHWPLMGTSQGRPTSWGNCNKAITWSCLNLNSLLKSLKLTIPEVLSHAGGFMYRYELRNSSVSLLYVGSLLKYQNDFIIMYLASNGRCHTNLKFVSKSRQSTWLVWAVNEKVWWIVYVGFFPTLLHGPSRKMIPIKSVLSRGGIVKIELIKNLNQTRLRLMKPVTGLTG